MPPVAEEYYDSAAEREKRRSIAEESLLEQLINMSRAATTSLDIMKSLFNQGDRVPSLSDIQQAHEKVKDIKARVEAMKDSSLNYLARIGNVIPHTNAYRDAILFVAKIVQYIESVIHRLYIATFNGLKPSPAVDAGLRKLASSVGEEYNYLESSLSMLQTNPRNSFDTVQLVSAYEDKIDSIYRELTLQIYNTMKDDIISLLIHRDIAEALEELADAVRDLGESIKIIALYRMLA